MELGCHLGGGPLSGTQALCVRLRTFLLFIGIWGVRMGSLWKEGQASAPAWDRSTTSQPGTLWKGHLCRNSERLGPRGPSLPGPPWQPGLKGARLSRAESRTLCSVSPAWRSPDQSSSPVIPFPFPEIPLVKPPGQWRGAPLPAAHRPPGEAERTATVGTTGPSPGADLSLTRML